VAVLTSLQRVNTATVLEKGHASGKGDGGVNCGDAVMGLKPLAEEARKAALASSWGRPQACLEGRDGPSGLWILLRDASKLAPQDEGFGGLPPSLILRKRAALSRRTRRLQWSLEDLRDASKLAPLDEARMKSSL
jgi:hypothetical protein